MTELHIALVGGAGFMGRAHSMAWSLAPLAVDLGVTVVKDVLVDVDADAAERAARQLGWNSSATSWEEVIARDDIDIIDIVTPPQFHAEIAVAAARAGKHVFCEKPLSNHLAEAQETARVARESGVVNQVGFNYRHAAAIAFAKKLLDGGKFGEILEFRGSYLNESGFTRDPNRWRSRRASGGSGQTGDTGSHLIDIAQYLVGPIRRVTALERSRSTEPDRSWRAEPERLSDPDLIEDTSLWLAEFDGGAVGTFSVSSYASGRKNRLFFELDAEEGAVEFDWNAREQFRVSYTGDPADHQGFRTIYTNTQHPNGWWRLAGLGIGYVDVSAVQFQDFVRAITRGEQARPDFTDAAGVQAVVEAISRSAGSGTWAEVEGGTK